MEPPVFFTKPADAVVPDGTAIPYPPATNDLHFEGELVLALGREGAALRNEAEAEALVYGYACGCDLTRRDLQRDAKAGGAPWDAAKAFDHAAPVGAILPRDAAGGALTGAGIEVRVNAQARQQAPLADMIWSPAEVIIALSRLFRLAPGDLVFTGTPAGVGPLHRGDAVRVTVGDLPALDFSIL
jgi:fumarylpyruvate hydrolase